MQRDPARRFPRDNGQALVLLVVTIVACAAMVAVGAAALGSQLHDRAAAQHAADAAALAGVSGGEARAGAVAAANGGELVHYREQPVGADVTVEVTVRVGRHTATARASNAP